MSEKVKSSDRLLTLDHGVIVVNVSLSESLWSWALFQSGREQISVSLSEEIVKSTLELSADFNDSMELQTEVERLLAGCSTRISPWNCIQRERKPRGEWKININQRMNDDASRYIFIVRWYMKRCMQAFKDFLVITTGLVYNYLPASWSAWFPLPSMHLAHHPAHYLKRNKKKRNNHVQVQKGYTGKKKKASSSTTLL